LINTEAIRVINISSLNNLRRLKAISEKKIGVERFISVKPEIKWVNLEKEEMSKE